MAMSYGTVYVARVAMGASDAQTLKVFREAEAFDGPSLIIAYSHCIAHGYDMAHGMEQQKAAVQSGYWPLLRYNPALAAEGKNPLALDSKAPTLPLKQYVYNESRYTMLAQSRPGGGARAAAAGGAGRARPLAAVRDTGRAPAANGVAPVNGQRRRRPKGGPCDDRPDHHVPGADAEKPAGLSASPLCQDLNAMRPDGGGGGGRGRAALAVRGADPPGERGPGPRSSTTAPSPTPRRCQLLPGHGATTTWGRKATWSTSARRRWCWASR